MPFKPDPSVIDYILTRFRVDITDSLTEDQLPLNRPAIALHRMTNRLIAARIVLGRTRAELGGYTGNDSNVILDLTNELTTWQIRLDAYAELIEIAVGPFLPHPTDLEPKES